MPRWHLTVYTMHELHEAASAVASHDPMRTRRDLTKDNNNNELNEEEEAAHDPMPTDGASTRAHILRVDDSKQTQPYCHPHSET